MAVDVRPAPRIIPAGYFATGKGAGRARLLVERNIMVYRHHWSTLTTGFFEPLFYLLSLGVGIGSIIGRVAGPDGRPVSYVAYVAPGLLASSAMNGAVYDSTMNIFFKLKYARTYEAMLATPMGPRDVAVGEITWAQLRGLLYSLAFLLVMLGMGLVHSWWFPMALPAAALIGYGFASIGMAATTFLRSWVDFELVGVVVMPIFLFSTTFYPLGVYPRGVQLFIEATPLVHGINLLRAFTLGAVSPGLIGDAAYFAVMALIGYVISTRRVEKLLLS